MNASETERTLQSLQPSLPSDRLESRIAADLDLDRQWMRPKEGHRPARWLSATGWASVGAAAAVVLMFLASDEGAPDSKTAVSGESKPAPRILPVATIREWVDAEDQGIQWNDQQGPERRVRLTTMERHAWIDPRDGAEMVVQQPRQETLLLPVNFQ